MKFIVLAFLFSILSIPAFADVTAVGCVDTVKGITITKNNSGHYDFKAAYVSEGQLKTVKRDNLDCRFASDVKLLFCNPLNELIDVVKSSRVISTGVKDGQTYTTTKYTFELLDETSAKSSIEFSEEQCKVATAR